jgi:glycosyltransferase involved in cell wall biosynthesis
MLNLVSVVIPVKNGGDYLDEVLASVMSQKTDFNYEVIIIDSGSRDTSLDIINKYDVKLITIPAAEFNHGLTRNLGVEKSTGKFIAFLTQDATPVNNQWLQNLVAPLRQNPQIAGVFGKHLARKDCDPIVALNLENHFKSYSLNRRCWKKDSSYNMDKSTYIFFSNNNSCIRRSVWEKIPFRKVDMAEDQWWAQDIIENGYIKCYEPNALVYHSHTYSAWEWLKRQFDEYSSYKKIGVVSKTSPLYYLKSFLILSLKDTYRLIKASQLSFQDKLYWIAQRILNNLGIVSGQFLGVNYTQIPQSLAKKIFSEQYRKQET